MENPLIDFKNNFVSGIRPSPPSSSAAQPQSKRQNPAIAP